MKTLNIYSGESGNWHERNNYGKMLTEAFNRPLKCLLINSSNAFICGHGTWTPQMASRRKWAVLKETSNTAHKNATCSSKPAIDVVEGRRPPNKGRHKAVHNHGMDGPT